MLDVINGITAVIYGDNGLLTFKLSYVFPIFEFKTLIFYVK